jgi:CheY-like chemotaxis protein
MTQPLALVLYERVLPGTRLVNRLQELNYRVKTLNESALLTQTAQEVKPMLVFADLQPGGQEVCTAITRLKNEPKTSHLPVIAFGVDATAELQDAARQAGATMVVSEPALLNHLPECLEQALRLD